MAERDDPLIRQLVEALGRSIDVERLRSELRTRLFEDGRGEEGEAVAAESGVAGRVLERFAMADVLDESILGARPGNPSFPLRVLFGTLAERADEEVAFTLGSTLNFYFRVAMDEETKVRVGLEVSRLYYRFVEDAGMEPELVQPLSPLVAKLLGTELSRLRLESVDHLPVFDSDVHERSADSDATRAAVVRPLSFLGRVTGNDRVRFKATVRT